jgi:hypothetical protein
MDPSTLLELVGQKAQIMTRIIQHPDVPNAEPPTVQVEVTVAADDVYYIEVLARTLSADDAFARQLRMKVEQILEGATDTGSPYLVSTVPEKH